jgi:hypothetical protein
VSSELHKHFCFSPSNPLALAKALGAAEPRNFSFNERFRSRLFLLIGEDSNLLSEVGIIFAKTRLGRLGALFFARAIVYRPFDADYYLNCGNSLQETGRSLEALQFYRRGLLVSPNSEKLRSNRGRCFERMSDFESALTDYLASASLAPAHFEAFYNHGTLFINSGLFESAVDKLRKALSVSPASASARWNLGLALLGSGRLEGGWKFYEARFLAEAVPAAQNFSFMAQGIFELGSSAVLVWAEQGVGDEVMFGSMLGEFRGHVGKLLVQLDRRLIPLFKRSLPDDVEFFERGTVVPEDRYDSHIAIGSLGQYLRPTLESFEGKGGKYLWADPERIQAMREWLSVKEGERVIGLSWRSSNPETGAARSLALKDLVKSLQAPGVRFVNLQYGDVSAEIEALERDEGITVLQCPGLDTTDDLDGLAALIEACDEVVSIGNATAHLAGALGKKTTVLLPKAPSWRWLTEGNTSPWYGSVSLSRGIDT